MPPISSLISFWDFVEEHHPARTAKNSKYILLHPCGLTENAEIAFVP
jgi:hypothetical protein